MSFERIMRDAMSDWTPLRNGQVSSELRMDGGADGLDVGWTSRAEKQWERVLTEQLTRERPRLAMVVSTNLLEELGGAEHVAQYGWDVEIRTYGDGSRNVHMTKTRWSVRRAWAAEQLDRAVTTAVVTMALIAVGACGLIAAVFEKLTGKRRDGVGW